MALLRIRPLWYQGYDSAAKPSNRDPHSDKQWEHESRLSRSRIAHSGFLTLEKTRISSGIL